MLDFSDFSILEKVISPSGMPYASASENYAFAEFARDAIEACLDIIPVLPKKIAEPIAAATIKRLAELQGEQNVEDILKGKDVYHLSSEDEAMLKQLTLSEERKGKIHHEHRSSIINDTPIPMHAQQILTALSLIWGGSENEMTYYGSLDSTPQFIRLIGVYCKQFGRDILNTTYQTKSGKTQTIRESLFAATSYIEQELLKSSLGLYEMYRINSEGLKNQTWKDSPSSFIALDKTLPDYEKPIIPISVQGLVYDALLVTSELLRSSHEEKIPQWTYLAENLQKQTFSHFWMDEENYFAIALSQNEENKWIQIKTISSDPAILLTTSIFDTLEDDIKQHYLKGIVTQIYSDQFVTDAGIRCRAKKHENLVDYSDYHGVEAVWAKETYDAVIGLRKQGFLRLAEQLGIRLLNSLRIADSFYELFFVKPDGRVDYDPNELRIKSENKDVIYATSIPEDTQTWTITAALSEYQVQISSYYETLIKNNWQYGLENELLKRLPRQRLLTKENEINAALPTNYSFHIDLTEGKKRAEKYENLLIHASLKE